MPRAANPSLADSYQSMLQAATWASLKNQCPKNHDKLEKAFAQNFPELTKGKALTEHLRQISNRSWPTTTNYMLWLMDALCTVRTHVHTIDHEVK